MATKDADSARIRSDMVEQPVRPSVAADPLGPRGLLPVGRGSMIYERAELEGLHTL